ncbi:MAG: sugar ABC transporter permease [Spirochaetales bacterium]|nr:sugar ABC transporter permease [Spirochaetales bacterium]
MRSPPPRIPPSLEAQNRRLGLLFVLPAVALVFAVIIYPVFFNLYLSLWKPALNPAKPDLFVGFGNYARLLADPQFYRSLALTAVYVALTVAGSTLLGGSAALLMNRDFRGRKFARSALLLSYVMPVISSVFVWIYLFNPLYGMVDYALVDLLGLFEVAPQWFDDPVLSLLLVCLFDIWRIFPFALIMILSSLQSIDGAVYEAALIDGARPFRIFRCITLPEILPVVASVVTLRSIWNFYKFEDVYLLTKQVPILGVYLYRTAFTVNDLGLASAISVVMFALVMGIVFVAAARRKGASS